MGVGQRAGARSSEDVARASALTYEMQCNRIPLSRGLPTARKSPS